MMSLTQYRTQLFDYHPYKNALNKYLARPSGGKQRPVFWDMDAHFPELRHLDAAYPAIRAEVEALLDDQASLPTYEQINAPSTDIAATTQGRWNVFMLELLGYRANNNLARCPHTARALAKVPNRIQAMFSLLDPGKSIPLHKGPYLGYLRYHLGLVVPQDNPPFIRVADQPYTWAQGQSVVFDDSWPHEVINDSSEPRVVLIVDIPRPLPPIPAAINKAILYGAAKPLYARKVIADVQRQTA